MFGYVTQELCGLFVKVGTEQGQLLQHRLVDELVRQCATTSPTVPGSDNCRVATFSFLVCGDFLRRTGIELSLSLSLGLRESVDSVMASSYKLLPQTHSQGMAGGRVGHDECDFPLTDRLGHVPRVCAAAPVVQQACNDW
jgi:hypothetical protein